MVGKASWRTAAGENSTCTSWWCSAIAGSCPLLWRCSGPLTVGPHSARASCGRTWLPAGAGTGGARPPPRRPEARRARLGLTTTDVPDRGPVDHDLVGPKHVAERSAQALERYLRGRPATIPDPRTRPWRRENSCQQSRRRVTTRRRFCPVAAALSSNAGIDRVAASTSLRTRDAHARPNGRLTRCTQCANPSYRSISTVRGHDPHVRFCLLAASRRATALATKRN